MTRIPLLLFPLLLALLYPAPASSQQPPCHCDKPCPMAEAGCMAWNRAPRLIAGGGRHTARLEPRNIHPTRYLVSRPDRPEPTPIPMAETGISYTPGSDNPGGYYRLIAREETPAEVHTATTLRYFSNPGPAPRALLAQPLQGLEIVPEKLPREHSHYRAGEEWPFLVRFNGVALAGAELTLASELGDEITVTADTNGRIIVRFPDRYKKHGGRHGRAKTRFVLGATHARDGKTHRSAFNYHFIAPHADGKSTSIGLGFLLLGMVLALPLLRRKKEGRK